MPSKLKRIQALITKEAWQIIRDPSTILIVIFFPLLILFLYGYGVSLDVDHLHIGIVKEDNSSDVQTLVESFKDSRFFSVKISHNFHSLTDDLLLGKIRAILIIPSYFSEFQKIAKLRHNQPLESIFPSTLYSDTLPFPHFRPNFSNGSIEKAPLYVIADGSEPNMAAFAQNYVQGTWVLWQTQQLLDNGAEKLQPFQIQSRFWYNEELNSRNFLIPGSIAIIMTLIGTLLTSLVVAREWERGTMEALMSTPVTMGEIFWSKLISYFALGMGSMLLCVLVSYHVYHVPFRGSPWMLFALSSVFLINSLENGLIISVIAKNQFVAAQTALFSSYLPAFILSGSVFEISSMPLPIQLLSYLIPARYFVSGLQTLFLVGTVWKLLLINIAAMTLYGLFCLIIISTKRAKRLD